ncbi:hypothetical protein ACR9E3_29795 [Actinomycetospora sp. C-140]
MAMIKVDTSDTKFSVGVEPRPKNDMEGRQRTDRTTGTPLFVTQLIKLDDDGAEIIAVTTPGAPDIGQGAEVRPVKLIAIPWQQGQRSGVAFKADAIEHAPTTTQGIASTAPAPSKGSGS